MVRTACGPTRVSIHRGGENGDWLHAGQVIARNSTGEADQRLEHLRTAAPATGIIRQAEADRIIST